MSLKNLRSETIRVIDQNANDFIVDKKESNNLVEVMGYLEVAFIWWAKYRCLILLLLHGESAADLSYPIFS